MSIKPNQRFPNGIFPPSTVIAQASHGNAETVQSLER